ncbi:NLR family CARD domain-containing protein 3-like isoform X2 [Salarias fasciatus]|uniref:NLR family CARD domain-containing protein 3-like isoform X2 n=1 Tax=Salarias fasciatus TaxID=181472 RepID=UPI00117708DB|nr:NLR family CARD domain-containing protein 3-like isoform X2 [Salarias fasciatus]
MEQTAAADQTEEILKVPSIRAEVHHPTYTAQNGSNVVVTSINGSHITNLCININSATQGSVIPSEEGPQCDIKQPQIDEVAECQRKLKLTLRRKFGHLLEGMRSEANKTPLNQIYTQLYITEGGSHEVNTEHEVRQIESTSRRCATEEKSIHCSHLFDPLPGRDRAVRTVLTRGVAGIGKTVSANKFCLDWAEETANTDLEFVFPLSFRELNLMRKKEFSLVELLRVFFPETKSTEIFGVQKKMLFILDGLDESRLSLDFNKSEIMSDVKQPTQIAVLLTNLIRGRLLPFALVWITSRPAASSQIPEEHIDLVTEVRGFNSRQKDEYFRRKISDERLATRVIGHVKSCRSLHIMCHIPVFCWMAASVLVKKLSTEDSKDTPKTLTQMYIHFLCLYVENMKRRLPGRRESNAENVRQNLLSLGKLAFKELERGHLIFYERDLAMNGINATQASMFSGIYTQVFSEEVALCEEKMFCFVHLSVQEFFAALYVFLTFHNDNVNVLVKRSSASRRFLFRESSELILYKEAVEKALRCENGHFDIFLRFLLGLSLESNQTLLKHLMTSNRTHQKTRGEIIRHIKERIRTNPSPDRCLNLFHCLNELNDHSLTKEIQSYLSSGSLNEASLSPAQWATLVFVLLTSEEELSVFELGSYSRSEEGLLRLLPVLKTARVAKLNACKLTAACCAALATAVSSPRLRELDLSHNNLKDAGLMQLSASLKTSKLEALRLRSCGLTEHSSVALASVISSASCQLKLLDLADNDLQDEGVKKLSNGVGSPHCQLETLSLSLCRVSEDGCIFLASALLSSRLTELDLSYNHPGPSGLTLLSTLLEEPRCRLQTLSVEQCGESRMQPGPKKSHEDISLSEGNRKARRWTPQAYPDHPERFDFWVQVLCKEGLTGRCYWEAEWSGRAFVGVAYRRMCRKGEGHDCWLGRNESSWGLNCNKDGYRALHNGVGAAVTATPVSGKVGVFLDWPAGTLSFYRVSCGALTLLHTFHTHFTEPVYPGFHLGWVDTTVYLC